MNALLAIKPEFAEKILAGEKRYEFRRTAFRDSAEIEFIYLYASAPVKRVVGLFTSERIIEASPTELWELFGEESGMENKERFLDILKALTRAMPLRSMTHIGSILHSIRLSCLMSSPTRCPSTI